MSSNETKELNNERRVRYAELALTLYRDEDDDPRANLTDLLADLMHWAKACGLDFAQALELARDHYACEEEHET